MAPDRIQNYDSLRPVFLVVAIIAAVHGFGGIAGTAAWIAQVCFVVFLIFAILGTPEAITKITVGREIRPGCGSCAPLYATATVHPLGNHFGIFRWQPLMPILPLSCLAVSPASSGC